MRPLNAHIDLDALLHNYQQARQGAPNAALFAVVKANAYGHGVREVVTTLQDCADGFAVACLEEAAEVRALLGGPRILLLEGCFDAHEYHAAARMDLDVVLHNSYQLEQLLATPLERPLRVWLKLDSGMHRLGLDSDDVRHWHQRLQAVPQLQELNLITHFACADEPEHPLTAHQLAVVEGLQDLAFGSRSLANSAALLRLPQSHCDWVRPGIMLYGASPFAHETGPDLGLRPVMSLVGRVMAVREVSGGECVGYGATWQASAPARIGTVSCGYADGYPRHAGPNSHVCIRGGRVPLAGRVSMDMLCIDLSKRPDVLPGDEVILWGQELPVDELAASCGTIGYELLTKVTSRVPRRYL